MMKPMGMFTMGPVHTPGCFSADSEFAARQTEGESYIIHSRI